MAALRGAFQLTQCICCFEGPDRRPGAKRVSFAHFLSDDEAELVPGDGGEKLCSQAGGRLEAEACPPGLNGENWGSALWSA